MLTVFSRVEIRSYEEGRSHSVGLCFAGARLCNAAVSARLCSYLQSLIAEFIRLNGKDHGSSIRIW